MKSSFYFDHDYNARNDQKILEVRAEFGWEGYAVFFALLETLCESNGVIKRGALGGLSLGLSLAKERLCEFLAFYIKIGLFNEDETGIYSQRILDHLSYRKMLSDSGSKGGRGNKKDEKPPFSLAKAPLEAGKERKGNNNNTKNDKSAPGGANVVFSKQREFYSLQVESSKNTREQKILKRYESFIDYLFETNPLKRPIDHILSIPIQLSFADYYKLLDETSKKDKDLKPYLDIIVNTPKYAQGRESLYLTLLGFINRA